jgi:hypothetical protein
MQQAQSSKNSLFLDRWSSAEIVNGRLGIVLMVMTSMCLTLSASLVYVLSKPRPIYYVPGVPSAGIAFAQTDPKATVSIFSAAWVLNWANFTPATIEEVYKHSQQFMSPHLLNQTKSRVKRDIEQVKSNNISSMFSINHDPLVQAESDGFMVKIKGDKGVYMGKEEIRTQKIIYHLRLRSMPPTDWNPYGLIIEEISQEMME